MIHLPLDCLVVASWEGEGFFAEITVLGSEKMYIQNINKCRGQPPPPLNKQNREKGPGTTLR